MLIQSNLPIGIQTFKDLIDWDYIYVDKTKEAFELVNNFRYVFLSRPRRFGKSLFLDTLKNIFQWNKELFKWLYIYDKWDWDVKYPVIHIRFDWDLRSWEWVKNRIIDSLIENQNNLDIKCSKINKHDSCLQELIQKAYEKYNQKVVILIDEYDKAILDNLDQNYVAMEAREILRWFYSIIKWNDEYIKFAFLTWVSKFSKASIFSWLNMIKDISLNPKYWNICWITQEELENNYQEYLQWADLKKIKTWYNWYFFLKDKVYNPFNLINFFSEWNKFKNYWFSSWTPAFLIKLLEKQNYYLPNISNLTVWEELLDTFDIENIKLEVILYQAWYLTIEKKIENPMWLSRFKLKIPNLEVRSSLFSFILNYLSNWEDIKWWNFSIYEYLSNWDIDWITKEIKSLFASIPYNNYTNNEILKYEWFYASIMYTYLESLWYEIKWEDVTNKWRIDLTIIMEDKIYVIEFKVIKFGTGTKQDKKVPVPIKPLQQIEEKKYYEKYLNKWKDIYLIWMIFDEEEKNIVEVESRKI